MNEISGLPNDPKIQPVTVTPSQTDAPAAKPAPQTTSSISVSEQEAHTKDPVSASPELPFPVTSFLDIDALLPQSDKIGAVNTTVTKDYLKAIELQMMQMTTKVLEKWVESVQDMGVQSAKFQAKKLEDSRKTEQIRQGIKSGEANEMKVEEGVQASILIGSLLLTGIMPGIDQIASASMAPLAQAIQSISITGVQALPMAFNSLVGIFGTACIFQASLQTLLAGGKDKGTINEKFIANYGAQIIKTITDKEFQTTLERLYVKTGPNAEGNVRLHIAESKLVLLGTALALSYHAETGAISGKEFEALVQGQFNLKDGDPRIALIGAFQTIFSGLPAKESAMLMANLKKYFDSKPSVKSLLEPSEAIASFHSPILTPLSPA